MKKVSKPQAPSVVLGGIHWVGKRGGEVRKWHFPPILEIIFR